jgi:glucan endo-1,3-alpha-glucosidase
MCSSLTRSAQKGWLDLQQYYISALKNGAYPSILRDRIFLWARLYPANVESPQDGVGKPSGWQYVGSFAVISLPLWIG